METSRAGRSWYKVLYIQVLIAVFIGVLVGCFKPDLGTSLKPLGDAFINLIRMIIAPIIFCTVVQGIASVGDFRKLGRVSARALIYFEVVSTFALLVGLIVADFLHPGAGVNFDPKLLGSGKLQQAQSFVQQAGLLDPIKFLLNIVPTSFFSAFATGDILQILLIAILSGFCIASLPDHNQLLLSGVDIAARFFFGILRMILRVAPIGAFGAIAFTVGSQGIGVLRNLGFFLLCFYGTALVFVVVVLGLIAACNGFSIFRFLIYIKEELLLVLGTSASEPALPSMLQKMERLGCSSSTVGLVVPLGYSFNLDGTNIYMTMAIIFLAQATNTALCLRDQIVILTVAMISSKGATGVTGSGFITLAATLSIMPSVPLGSLALLVGVDRFMSECRALTNLIGNGVATVVISRWEKELTKESLNANLRSFREKLRPVNPWERA